MIGPLLALAPPSAAPVPRRWTAALAVLACLAAGPALTQESCDDAVTQADLNECTALAFEAADEELNLAYEAALDVARTYDTSPEGWAEDSLRAAQRAWVAFRDAACESEAALWDGGSAQPMVQSGCLERLTVQRTDDLWSYAEN
jgi:uncharacterized protein YecT (DUF1311 family)